MGNIENNNKLVKGTGMTFRPEDVIEARYQLSSRGNDIIDIVLSKLEKDDNTRYIIDINDYKKYYDETTPNTYRQFKATVDEMREKGLEIRNKEKNEYIYYPWFTRIHYINDEGRIEVDLHKELKKILLEVKRKIYFNLKYSTKLKSEYAKRLYYYARFYVDTGWRIDKVEELADKLECPKSYKTRYNPFKTKVLEIAKEQINEYSDIKIEFEEIRKGKKVVSIKMLIRKKDVNELEELNKLNHVEIHNRRTGVLRYDIEDCINRYKKMGIEINTELKKSIATEFGISERSLARYIYINDKLIFEMKEMYDKNFITLRESEVFAKKSIDEQQKELKRINRNIKKSRSLLINELQEKLDNYEISYHQMLKYSEMSYDKQMEVYKKTFLKEKVVRKPREKIENEIAVTLNDEIIDIDYKEIKEKTYIEEIRDILVGVKLSDDEINDIYVASERNIEYIEYIYKEMNKQEKEVRNAYKWLKAMVVPNKYKEPITITKKENSKFFNFKGRDYDYDAIEEQLLANNRNCSDETEIINSDCEEDIVEKLIKNKEEDKEEYNSELTIIKLQLEDILKEKYGEVKYMTWLKTGIDNLRLVENKAIFLVVNQIAYEIVTNNYLPYLNEVIKLTNMNIENVELQLKD